MQELGLRPGADRNNMFIKGLKSFYAPPCWLPCSGIPAAGLNCGAKLPSTIWPSRIGSGTAMLGTPVTSQEKLLS